MGIVTIEASIAFMPPNADGIINKIGLSRDWRFDERWYGVNCGFNEKLGCIGPTPDISPRDNLLSYYTTGGNGYLRETLGNALPAVKWLEFYDGAAHASGTAYTTAAAWAETVETLQPSVALHLDRKTPPAGQGVPCQTTLQLCCQCYDGATWRDGYATLVLPYHDSLYPEPYLHIIASRPTEGYDTLRTGGIVLRLNGCRSDGGANGKGDIGTWALRYSAPPPDVTTGGWIFIEHGGREWIYQHAKLRLVAGHMLVSCCGMPQCFNLAPMRWGLQTTMQAFAPEALALPDADEWNWDMPGSNDAVIWGGLETPGDSSEWNATTFTYAPTVGVTNFRPLVRFNPKKAAPLATAPVAWFATQTILPAMDEEYVDATETSTDSDYILESVELTQNDKWRGANGSATFIADVDELLPNLRENGKLRLKMGFNATAGTGLVAADLFEGYVKPGGIRREALENGTVRLTVDFGDFAEVRLANTVLRDFRQAGFETVAQWAVRYGNALGIPTAKITVDAAVAGRVIPGGKVPSEPALAPDDGTDPIRHADDVERAAGVRVGFNRTVGVTMFVDAGPAVYSHLTSPLAVHIKATPTTPQDTTFKLAAEKQSLSRNALKLVVGKQDKQQQVYYYVQPFADRIQILGDLWWDVLSVGGMEDAAAALTDWQRRNIEQAQASIGYGHIGRIDIPPEAFVMQDDDLANGVIAGSAFRVFERTLRYNRQTCIVGESDYKAVLVYGAA